MNIFKQLTALSLLSLAGVAISHLIPFPFPAGVVCMILLFLLFCTGKVKLSHLQETTDFLSRYMAILFIPAGVGLIRYLDLLKSSFIPILLVCLISTVITFAATAYTVQFVILLQEKYRKGRDSRA
ncbi:MAG: CidA/LrgA family protein [Clostridia bacterium]|nr:CidA/LrgA family protein [Clostridia bacterium]